MYHIHSFIVNALLLLYQSIGVLNYFSYFQ